uniref:Uncharacterized protein n=1 Tax=Clytia hemisphaerica TaxID=252671 RepID=A0A7M5V486_9CNID
MKKKSIISFIGLFALVTGVRGETIVAKGFDAFLYRPVTANTTCGSPAEQYYNTKEGYVAPRSRLLSVCDASNPHLARPPSFMTDGNDTSSWQSINNQDKAYISISLEQPVYGKQLVFQFGDYRRPGQIAIYKSTDFGRTWQPWHFMVTQQHECTTVFGIPESEIYVLPDENVQRVLCQQYSGYPFDFGEKVVIELNGDIRGDGSNIHEAKALMEWMNVTNVHIRFSGLFRKFDYIDTRWHHYVVSTISMIARCDCNGHGDGLSCPLNKITGNRKCDCLDNTCGDRCERCCPAFNQYPWRKGSRTSWISDNTTACEQCNCHNHSDTCRYDADVAKNELSLDMKGQYAGGGVCLNCRDNTEGINCEKCQKYFYRPPGVDVTSLDACPPCKCHPAGSRATGQGISYLECVRDREMALFHDRNVGDCFCRSNVIGTKCDTCKDGFYRLELSNPNGCRSCRCYLAGTFQRLNICHKDFFGQCPCKANVKLRDCSSCKDGYFNLQNDNPNGCTWCDCDVGGSISPYICDKSTGTCTCRAHIKSKRCKEVEDGFYFPDMHYISALRYQYAQATDSLSTKITIPHDSTYKLFIGYTLLTRNIVNVELRMSLEGSSALLFGPAYPGASLFFCNEECREGFQSSGNGDFVLKAGVYQVQIFSQGSNNGLKLERLIAIPLQFMQASILTSEDRTLFQTSCSVEANDLRIGTTSAAVCLAGAFSMTVKFEDGALPCNCNPIGSINSTCNKVAGQCFCKPGVTGRDCSRCSPGFYNFTSHGCQACGCKGVDKICNPQTGECNCPENFQGRVCDACQCNGNSNKCQRDGKCLDCQSNTFGDHCEMCKPSFYGDALQGDCKACGCHAEGAINTTCHMITGQCFCRPGVIGKTCSQCDINHYDLTDTGCKSCRCNEHGSALLQCNNAGVCSCLSSAEGMKCDLCSAGFFGLPDKPCQSCDCNSTGTVTSTTCKNDVDGQCVCKTGVDGRQCDTCRKQYADFGPSGCRQCPLCTRKLQRHADEVASKLENVQVDMNLTKQLSTLQKELHQTENYLQTVQLEGVMFENRILRGQRDYNSLHDNKLITWNDRLSKLINQINEVTSRAIGMKPSALSIQQNMEIYYIAAKAASQKTSEAQEIARDVFFSHLMNLTSLASDVVKKGYTYVQDVPTFKFEFYQQTIDDDLTASNTLLGNVTSIGKEVQYQATVASAYLGALAQSEAYFQTKERIWAASMASFLMEIENVHKKGDDVKLLLDQTKEHVDAQRDFISSIQNESQAVDLLLKDNMKLYKLTHGLYEHAFQSTVKIVGGVEVMFLEYNPQNKILRVNVLRGYSLAARDLPSRKADPYFKLSIHPKWFNQGPFQSSPEISTLDPTWQWPIGGTYSFFIRLEQMRETQLVIQVFDGDDENDDDFMGEAVIDMNKILPIILNGATQNTYPLKPQGYSQRWLATFPGPGENGIEDLQNMLSQQIDFVQRLLKETNSTHAKAVEKANQLQSEAQLLKSSFTQAKSLSSRAVAAVNTYNQIYRLINSSMLSAMTANQSVQAIQTILKGISVSTFSARANEALLAAQYYLMQVRKRNVTYAGMEMEIRSETFGSNGIHIPPKSSIKINNIEYHPNINGHTILLIDYRTGRIESVQTFRTDIDISASSAYSAYLSRIPTGKIIIIVKQGEGSIQTADKNDVMSRLLELGGRAPFFSGHRGSYILLGFRLQRGENIPWITQVAKVEAGGASYLKKTITLKC